MNYEKYLRGQVRNKLIDNSYGLLNVVERLEARTYALQEEDGQKYEQEIRRNIEIISSAIESVAIVLTRVK